MSRIDEMFARKKAEGSCALIMYVTMGYPDVASTEHVIDALVENGTDLIELGMPFSDPLADGPTIQHASKVALERGITVQAMLELTTRVRTKHPHLPLLLFGAYNPILHRGVQSFVKEATSAGVDGLLVPDLPPEAAAELRAAAEEAGISVVFLIAPTTTPERAKLIAEASTGFIYYISLRGVTGARVALADDLEAHVRAIKALTEKPVAVGFGVSAPEQARAIAGYAEGVIVGSALIKLVGEHEGKDDLAAEVGAFSRGLAEAMSGGAAATVSK